MNDTDVRHMIALVRAIGASKWTDELPEGIGPETLQHINAGDLDTLRAVQTAEAFMMLAFNCGHKLDAPKFIASCGLNR